MSPFKRLMAIRTGGGTERCHGIRHQGSYNVAAHSWGVAVLMYILWPEDFPRLAIYCIVHDVPEAWIGDIPATTKRYSTEVKEACSGLERAIFSRLDLPNDGYLLPEDAAKLKSCDHLELYLWAKEQVYGGNLHADCVRRQLETFFRETPLLPEANVLYEVIRAGETEHATDGLIKELTRS